ncbi:hypothetical protein C1701_20505 [Actinoalloteichus sp. AHMU CJ021]|uniref:Uncharacterized protein n=1 Tax=Actinoalloteichus caeruleus DSM 43889 TaxID=1120930 RepID=A0ABT1JPX3_ACTCY|nr:hypothetical protein [Actinoalloteichus caeruleus]AUS80321.1 hypothetical protein C1701_20505 [Actinoalloteichus sp. AHMU CJ021]MCP2334575.1 hypothetical protein [Actinoalloteichus caeruleus DSM 43889]
MNQFRESATTSCSEAGPRESLSLHPTTVAAIARVAESENVPYTEALRRLVADGRAMHRARASGGRVVVRYLDGREEPLRAGGVLEPA